MLKYKVVNREGCLSYGISINDKEWSSDYEPVQMSDQEKEEFVDFLLEEFKRQLKDNTVSIDELLGCFQYDSCEKEDGYCETCGDSVSETTWLFNEPQINNNLSSDSNLQNNMIFEEGVSFAELM